MCRVSGVRSPHLSPSETETCRESILPQKLRERTGHLEILERLDEVIRPLDQLAARPWFREAVPFPVPRLADYLDLESVEKRFRGRKPP